VPTLLTITRRWTAYRAVPAAGVLEIAFPPVMRLSRGGAAQPLGALQIVVRDGCPHCAQAKPFLDGLARQRSDVPIVYQPVDEDPEARAELVPISRAAGIWRPGVPPFVFDGRVRVGFGEDGQRAAAVRALMIASAVIALRSRQLTERAGRWLKLLSGVVTIALGGAPLLRPQWLS
jgi:glutaredoxin